MIIKTLYSILFAGFCLASCGIQKRTLKTSEKVNKAKQEIDAGNNLLSDLQSETEKKLGQQRVDSSINTKIASLLAVLQSDLNRVQQTVNAVDFFLEKKKNFRPNNYETEVKDYVTRLDSFQLKKDTRDKIYRLLNEAVKVDAFQKYGMGAFYNSGVYRIAPAAFNSIQQSFQPAIDSIVALSNRYSDIKRKVHVVVVGYADGSSISSGTNLYNELKSYSHQADPNPSQLNLILSDLRASELLRNLKMLMLNNAKSFTNYNTLKIGYLSYGRGEALPFSNISDYKENDERRRVVVFYWALLPDTDAKGKLISN